jgi:SAM-dependent methyltransferase
MGPATSSPSSATLAGRFYDALASDYDAMTGFDRRFERERPFFQQFVQRYAVQRAVDAGAGTGFHSLLLAQLGVDMIAVDISAEMLARAGAHARMMGLHITTLQSSLIDVAARVGPACNAVVCMGNTLAHFTEKGSREAVLGQFHRVLAPGGVLLVQGLNFDRIMMLESHIQNVKEEGGVRYVREYVRTGALVDLRVTRTALSGQAPTQVTTSVTLAPFYAADLARDLLHAGFAGVHLYGSIDMEPFSTDVSRDIVAICTRT